MSLVVSLVCFEGAFTFYGGCCNSLGSFDNLSSNLWKIDASSLDGR